MPIPLVLWLAGGAGIYALSRNRAAKAAADSASGVASGTPAASTLSTLDRAEAMPGAPAKPPDLEALGNLDWSALGYGYAGFAGPQGDPYRTSLQNAINSLGVNASPDGIYWGMTDGEVRAMRQGQKMVTDTVNEWRALNPQNGHPGAENNDPTVTGVGDGYFNYLKKVVGRHDAQVHTSSIFDYFVRANTPAPAAPATTQQAAPTLEDFNNVFRRMWGQ